MDYHSDNNDCCSDAKQRQPCINNALKYSIPFNVFRHILYTSKGLLSTLGNSQPLKTLHFQSTPFFLHLHFSVDF